MSRQGRLNLRGMVHFASEENRNVEGKLKDAATRCVLRPVDASTQNAFAVGVPPGPGWVSLQRSRRPLYLLDLGQGNREGGVERARGKG